MGGCLPAQLTHDAKRELRPRAVAEAPGQEEAAACGEMAQRHRGSGSVAARRRPGGAPPRIEHAAAGPDIRRLDGAVLGRVPFRHERAEVGHRHTGHGACRAPGGARHALGRRRQSLRGPSSGVGLLLCSMPDRLGRVHPGPLGLIGAEVGGLMRSTIDETPFGSRAPSQLAAFSPPSWAMNQSRDRERKRVGTGGRYRLVTFGSAHRRDRRR